MKRIRNQQDPLYVPDYFAGGVGDIDFAKLKKDGVKVLAFDADNTLIAFSLSPFHPKHIGDKLLKKLQKNRKLFDKWIIASNRPTNDLQELATSIRAQVVRAGLLHRKPRKEYFREVIKRADVKPGQIAMVGDKLLADMYGAKRTGMKTVMVKPVGADNPLDWLIQTRRLERWLLKKFIKPSSFS
ncbi:MAG: HAD-IIIA family hydrolase [Candidatus Saccharibacteria bacterium]|nr:HAD-IIIA family hydrolase [Candidatus Saccharibacteria bacterium]